MALDGDKAGMRAALRVVDLALPLIEAGQIDSDEIIIDAKSGVSGAGRDAKQGSLYAEVTEGIHAYGVASHRHAPEIEQGLSEAAGRPVVVNFTPHLMPMSRGILATSTARLTPGTSAAEVRAAWEEAYADEPFVQLLPEGSFPRTADTLGANTCLMGVAVDEAAGRVVVVAALDNLAKGTAGAAIQSTNIALGLDETLGLPRDGVAP